MPALVEGAVQETPAAVWWTTEQVLAWIGSRDRMLVERLNPETTRKPQSEPAPQLQQLHTAAGARKVVAFGRQPYDLEGATKVAIHRNDGAKVVIRAKHRAWIATHSARLKIPWTTWADAKFQGFDRLVVKGRVMWSDLLWRVAEVTQEWPRQQQRLPDDDVARLMLYYAEAEARSSRKVKRDAALSQCMKEGATKRQGMAAYARLDPRFKNKRGRPLRA